MNKGFTLIELLVVVLIIGILASIAVPQYFKIIEKTKTAEAISLLGQIFNAEQRYYTTNGEYTSDLSLLDIKPPGDEAWDTTYSKYRYKTKNFEYAADTANNGYAHAYRNSTANTYYTIGIKFGTNEKYCATSSNTKYQYICTALGGVLDSTACASVSTSCYKLP